MSTALRILSCLMLVACTSIFAEHSAQGLPDQNGSTPHAMPSQAGRPVNVVAVSSRKLMRDADITIGSVCGFFGKTKHDELSELAGEKRDKVEVALERVNPLLTHHRQFSLQHLIANRAQYRTLKDDTLKMGDRIVAEVGRLNPDRKGALVAMQKKSKEFLEKYSRWIHSPNPSRADLRRLDAEYEKLQELLKAQLDDAEKDTEGLEKPFWDLQRLLLKLETEEALLSAILTGRISEMMKASKK